MLVHHNDYRSGGRLMLARFRTWEAKSYLREAEQAHLHARAAEAAGDDAGVILYRAKSDVLVRQGRDSLKAASEIN